MTKFGTQTQMLTQATKMWENLRNSQIEDGGRTPYWKSFLAITRLHIVRLRWNLEFGSIIARIRLGNENVQFRKSNMADGRHFENRYISISQSRIVRIWGNLVCISKFWPRRGKRDKNAEIPKIKMADGRRIENHLFGYNSAAYCPIKKKFEVRRQNHTKQIIWPKCLITKIQNSGSQHFKNGYTSVCEPRIFEIWRNMVRRRKFWHSRGYDKHKSELNIKRANIIFLNYSVYVKCVRSH